jgi:hypothetical protein
MSVFLIYMVSCSGASSLIPGRQIGSATGNANQYELVVLFYIILMSQLAAPLQRAGDALVVQHRVQP